MKKMFILLMALAIGSAAFSQQNSASSGSPGDMPEGSFSIGINAGIPTSYDFYTGYNVGFGGHLEYSKGIAPQIVGFVQGGYSLFSAQSADSGVEQSPNMGLILGLVGARYFLSPNFGLGLGIGYGDFTSSDGSGGGLAYAPMAMYKLSKIALSLSFNSITKDSDAARYLNIGVAFKL